LIDLIHRLIYFGIFINDYSILYSMC